MVPNPDAGIPRGMILEWPARADTMGARGERFEACFRDHYARVLAYALRRVPDRAGAEDVAADTFLVAWRRRDDIPDDALPWLLGIARHVIHNELRSSRRRERLASRVGAEPPSGEDAPAELDPGTTDVMHALGRLGERDREVLLLSSWDGLDHRRAAIVLGCTRGAFAVRLHRARVRLARELGEIASAAGVPPTLKTKETS